jgi:hypothetical protein
MKKLLWSVAAVGLLATACSKDEVEEYVTEGGSALATPVGGSAKSNNNGGTWNFHVWNEAYFNQGQGSLWAKRSGNPARTPTVAASFTVRYEDSGDAVSGMFSRVGNSPNYRSASNLFSFTPADDFSLLSLSINWNAADGTPQEESGSIFLYPSGRPVVQDPKVVRFREQGNGEFVAILADDPVGKTVNLTYVDQEGVHVLEKTHFNQNLGLSRWKTLSNDGITPISLDSWDFENHPSYLIASGEPVSITAGSHNHTYSLSPVSGVFVDGKIYIPGDEAAVGRPNVWQEIENYDEPLIMGSKLTSRNNGGTFNLTVAVAELGDPLQTVRCTFGESDGPAPIGDTFLMQLVGEGEGGLKVYEVSGIRFNGNPAGSEYEIFFQFGTGTRSTAGNAKQKAELL